MPLLDYQWWLRWCMPLAQPHFAHATHTPNLCSLLVSQTSADGTAFMCSYVFCVADCLSVLADARLLLLVMLTVILRLISLDVAGIM